MIADLLIYAGVILAALAGYSAGYHEGVRITRAGVKHG